MKSVHLLLAILLVPGISNAQAINNINKSTKKKESEMSAVQKNKEVILKLYEQSLNKKNMGLLKDFVSENYTGLQGKKGVPAFEEPIAPLFKAFPDIQWKLDDVIAEGDQVAVKWSWQGTHTAQIANFTATGKTVSNTGMAVFEFKDGKIINSKVLTDRLGFLQELGALPHDLTQLTNKKANKDRVNFIDKFFIPAAAKDEFYGRMSINRNFIKTLPGFIGDEAYQYTDNNGNLVCITVAQWENKEALNKAKEAVQAEYKKQGFDTAEMFKRLNITADRGIYTELENH
jgi:steroid delta-isomerase-like uncharacterized protein